MDTDDRDQLWDLLGKAGHPEASPFFARNVTRAVRQTRRDPADLWMRNLLRVLIPTGAAALALVLSIGQFGKSKPAEPNPLVAQIVRNPDYDVINHLDELLASEENALWLENSVN